MRNLRDIYANKAVSQIPRLLTLLDRNEFSKTYGSFQRTYWLDKSDDFVNALPQYGVHSLALVYNNRMPGNIFYKQEKIKKWTIAAIDYWTRIQHKDGSFDEFYPNEHGWAGPTGFLLYAMIESYKLFRKYISNSMKDRFLETCRKAAVFLGKYDEDGILANHHAMALMPIYYAYDLLGDRKLKKLFHDKLNYFYTLVSKEGWSLEYDGADLGYLSATVSFLSKLYKLYKHPRVFDIIKRSIEFSGYFVYPNGYYAGSMGSRQTLHFYPHGYEIFAKRIPLAGAIADKMLIGLNQGKLVPPEIQADRYFLYRIPEFLLSYIDYTPRGKKTLVPYERKPFQRYFSDGKFFVKKSDNYYFVSNFAKGGVMKVFDKKNNLIYNDNGIIGKVGEKTATSQWINKKLVLDVDQDEITINGKMSVVPSKVFNPYKGLVFRAVMLTLGSNTFLSYKLKGLIRKLIIFGDKKLPMEFNRNIKLGKTTIEVTDTLHNNSKKPIESMKFGDEFFVRYVPQSRYFQPEELKIKGYYLGKRDLRKLNDDGEINVKRLLNIKTGKIEYSTF